MPRSHRRLRRRPLASNSWCLHRLLQRTPNASVVGQGFAEPSARSTTRSRHRAADSRMTSSSILPDVVFGRHNYVLFFVHLESRRVDIAGITVHPDEAWMKQIARNTTMDDCGALRDWRYLLHDRDTKFTRSFRAILISGRVEALALPARSPNLNAYAEQLGEVGQ